ncbi:MAG TPA: TetR/AcrR family transcriptional regulator [Baekduia sp.]|nr:TetR/AcrR family transcriptional regulator [Baekduia sp.]
MPTVRKRIPRAEREQRMLDAAEVVFGRESFQAASMEEIAKRSGITKALLYQYFASKEGLYEACVERGRARLFAALAEATDAAEPGRARLVAFVEGYFDYVEANRHSWWLLYGETSSVAVNAMRERNAELIAELVAADAATAGRAVDADALAVLAHSLVGAGEQVGRWWLTRPDVTKADVVARFLAMAGGAIGVAYQAAPAVKKPRRSARARSASS